MKKLPGSHHLVVPTAAELRAIPPDDLQAWCHSHARYGLVTQELVHWLRHMIAGRNAIEIAAGMGDLGFAVGIPMTDSAVQTTPVVRLYYSLHGVLTIDPPKDVERLEASEAVAKYKPEVVVASWATQLYKEGDVDGSVFGVDEERLITEVDTYIHIGNLRVHREKRILATTHDVYEFPWLCSSALYPQLNRIWVWNRRR